ncbi:hypothetical protein [Hymenobacter arizonensis]|uniref:RdRp catalytic domain-containing protein n=1 Tax=Hymenobacter arizonensis TaxID=1227077 RepID=A0A1I6BEW7_HYMAR|nr:hypothetical protein [Hymenobacter arizonensis]SFQ79454.1 hypothetical protein SAMN04515668_4444 [Hymenobacter arizonensis]
MNTLILSILIFVTSLNFFQRKETATCWVPNYEIDKASNEYQLNSQHSLPIAGIRKDDKRVSIMIYGDDFIATSLTPTKDKSSMKINYIRFPSKGKLSKYSKVDFYLNKDFSGNYTSYSFTFEGKHFNIPITRFLPNNRLIIDPHLLKLQLEFIGKFRISLKDDKVTTTASLNNDYAFSSNNHIKSIEIINWFTGQDPSIKARVSVTNPNNIKVMGTMIFDETFLWYEIRLDGISKPILLERIN